MPGLEGQPFNNVYSYSEGLSGDSNGDLYFFVSGESFTIFMFISTLCKSPFRIWISDFDQSIKDMKKHNFTSMVLSEYQNGVCKEKKLDPEDVLCARLTISGSFTTVKIHDSSSTRIFWFLVFMNRIKVEKSNPKYSSALKAFSEKHPFAKEWINMGTPDWHLKQMNISQ